MHRAGGRSSLTAGKIRRGRSVFQQRFEYRLWSTRHRQHFVKDHHRGGGRLYAFGADAFTAGGNRFAVGLAVSGAGSNSDTSAAGISSRDEHSLGPGGTGAGYGTGGFTIEFAKVSLKSQTQGLRCNCYLTTLAEVAELADAHV